MSSSYQLGQAGNFKFLSVQLLNLNNALELDYLCTQTHTHKTTQNQSQEMIRCNHIGPQGRCKHSWKRTFVMNKTNCIHLGRSHIFNLPEQAPNEQAPNMSHTDKGKGEE